MRVAILSRNPRLHSTQRLHQEAVRLGIACDIVDPLECQLLITTRKRSILITGQPLPHYNAILPRIGTSITDYGLAVVRQFESLGTAVVNGSPAILDSRDKMRCLQILAAARIPVPPTAASRSRLGMEKILEELGGVPVVMKLLRGTQGLGVMLLNSRASVTSVGETLQGLRREVILQRFLLESGGQDYRAIVIDGKVIASMRRSAPEGDFRSNLHRGGEGQEFRLPRVHQRLAIRAAQALGLEVAGVDLMDSTSGPVVIELNSTPGFEGIEAATGRNVARAIMEHLVRRAQRTR